jgi:hypothetical protein
VLRLAPSLELENGVVGGTRGRSCNGLDHGTVIGIPSGEA